MVYKVLNDKNSFNSNSSASILESLSCDYVHYSIQAAIDQSKAGDVIKIQNGVYNEKIHITTSNITIIGESMEGCRISFDDYALKEHEDGNKFGTFRSFTFLVLADNVCVQNLTIVNKAGDGRRVGQAIALYAEGDKLQFINCNLMGYQDTLFVGPLPKKPMIPGSFVGPSDKHNYKRCQQYYENCRIVGDIDFIFGSALALFNACTLVSRDRKCDINGYITAPSTWQGEKYGFVFINCHIRGEIGIDPGTVYLGRPWRPYGQVRFMACTYDASIHQDYVDPWGKEENKRTARFSMYACCLIDENINNGVTSNTNIDTIKAHETEVNDQFIHIDAKACDMDFLHSWHQKILQTKINR